MFTKKTESNEDKSKEPDDQPAGETYTLDNAIELTGFGLFQIILTFNVGICWLANAVLTVVISVVGPLIACDWIMKEWEITAYTAIAFLGMIIGSTLFGILSDKIGRKKSHILQVLIMFVFAAISAASPNTWFMMACRAILGVALGGLPAGMTLCSEYYPIQFRGVAGLFLCFFWVAGILLTILGSWALIQFTTYWRWFLLLSSAPALLSTICGLFCPESVRYYLSQDMHEAAQKELKRVAFYNKKELPPGTLIDTGFHEESHGDIKDLFTPEYRKTTLIFWYLWFAINLNYFGLIYLTPLIVEQGSLKGLVSRAAPDGPVICPTYSMNYFVESLWTTAAEIPGVLLFTIVISFIKRKVLTSVSLSFLTIATMLLIVDSPYVAKSALFVARALSSGLNQLLYVVTAECFPTNVRGTAMGTSSALSQVGAFLSPITAEILATRSPVAAVCVLGGSVFFCVICAVLLPKETKETSLD